MSYTSYKNVKLFDVNKRPDVKYPVLIIDNAGVQTTTPVIELLKQNRDYVFTVAVTRLTINEIEFGGLTTTIAFKSGSDATTLDYPDNLYWINDEIPEIEADTEYLIAICNGIAVINSIQTITEGE